MGSNLWLTDSKSLEEPSFERDGDVAGRCRARQAIWGWPEAIRRGNFIGRIAKILRDFLGFGCPRDEPTQRYILQRPVGYRPKTSRSAQILVFLKPVTL